MRLTPASALVLVALAACSSDYPAAGSGDPAGSVCGAGTEVSRDSHLFCAYASSATGDDFACPVELPNRYDGDGYVVCADVQGLTSDDVDAVAKAAGVGDGGAGGAGGTGGGGGAGAGGAGGATELCATVADCYPDGYCASDALCYSVQPGAPGNDCNRVTLAPPQDAGGPVIFDVGQDSIDQLHPGGLCIKAPASCANNGNVCQFSFQAYDPDGDLAVDHHAIYGTMRYLDGNGTLISPYDVLAAAGSTYFIQGCYDEAAVSVTGAVILYDLAGHGSNALCFEGSAP